MKRILLFILLGFTLSASAQPYIGSYQPTDTNTVKGSLRVDSNLILASYTNSDTTYYLTTNDTGGVILRKLIIDTSRSGIATSYYYVDSLFGTIDLSGVRDSIVTAFNDISDAQDSIAAHRTDIGQNATDIATNVSDIASLTTTVAGKVDTAAMNDSLSGVRDSIVTAFNDISDAQDSIAAHRTDIGQNATDIATNVSDIASLTTTVAGKVDTAAMNDSLQDRAWDLFSLHVQPRIDSEYVWMTAAILRPSWNGSTNDWILINDGSHVPMHINSVSANSNYVQVSWDSSANQIVTAYVVPDESMITATTTSAGYPYFNEGPYYAGPSVNFNNMLVYIGKMGCWCGSIKYDSTSATWNQSAFYPTGTWNPVSKPLNITWNGAGYMDIRTDSIFNMKSHPKVQIDYTGGNDWLWLDIKPRYLGSTWTRVYIKDPLNSFANVTTPRHNMDIQYDFGARGVSVNPLTERFASGSNFWIFFVGKGTK